MLQYKIQFSWIGLIIFALPMLINIVYFVFPPVNAPSEAEASNKIWEMIEQVTRVLYVVAICILVSNEKIDFKSPWFYFGIVFLVLYYIVWIRYFMGGRDVALLGKSFLFVPMPLAVFPVLYFFFSAIWLHNYIAAIIMVVFGIAHNLVSYASFGKY